MLLLCLYHRQCRLFSFWLLVINVIILQWMHPVCVFIPSFISVTHHVIRLDKFQIIRRSLLEWPRYSFLHEMRFYCDCCPNPALTSVISLTQISGRSSVQIEKNGAYAVFNSVQQQVSAYIDNPLMFTSCCCSNVKHPPKTPTIFAHISE